jgi:tetratricopeptide (TPR) repeat protein
LFGLGFFLVNLAPFTGFFTASYMDFTWVMDHLLYIPLIGLIGLAVAATEQLSGQLTVAWRLAGGAALAVVLSLLAWTSHAYAEKFVNQETLWGYAVACEPTAWLPHNNLGKVWLQAGRIPEAEDQFEQALQFYPDYPQAHYNLGVALAETGHAPEAIAHYETALRFSPTLFEAHLNLGGLLLKAGRVPEATDQFALALKVSPQSSEAHNNMGVALTKAGRIPEAIEQVNLALQLDPNNANAQGNLAVLEAMQRHAAAK